MAVAIDVVVVAPCVAAAAAWAVAERAVASVAERPVALVAERPVASVAVAVQEAAVSLEVVISAFVSAAAVATAHVYTTQTTAVAFWYWQPKHEL